MTLIAHCQKKKCVWIYCCKGCVIHIRIVQEEGNESAQDLYTQNNKAFINAFHAWVQKSHATKVCRDFVGQLVLWVPNCTLTVSVSYTMYWLLLNPDNMHNIYHTQLLLHSNYILGRIKKSRKQGNT